jgi:hypothetical protein
MQETVCPPGAAKIRACFLREQLRALGHEELLLKQIAEEDLAVVVESTAWRSLRPKLLARAESAGQFTADELRALRKAGHIPTPGLPKPAAIEAAFIRQHEALEKAERHVGMGPGPGTSANSRMRLAESMQANPFVISPREHPLSPPVDLDQLSRMLLQVLEASDAETARELIQTFDATLEKYEDLRPEVVAELVQERAELADKVRTIPVRTRRWLFLVCGSATGSVLGKGLELALKALVGG